ncbi:MAG: GMC family oxidoreductase [Fluviicoccus sp.]|uniref:GMC family oxidoreductase n=1 Tax=Fluviicoccus sp. TaxID=2003552 RepID=UPI0027219991|nr:GMC family oxidoreductase [Fluviicoccus sp.]MDO8330654.1 GMC family oxidoreductase [Fluviicoccus sp.]
MTDAVFPHHATALALSEALFPAGRHAPAGDRDAITRRVETEAGQRPWLRHGLITGLRWLDTRYRLFHFRPFHKATVHQRREFLQTVAGHALENPLLRAATLPFKLAYLLDETQQQAAGSRLRLETPSQVERFRWQSQVTAAADRTEDLTLEADVVVIGTGAGGAAAAYELASRGLAVVMLEEGDYHDRRDFDGDLMTVLPKLYRMGATVATGNVMIPVPVGRSVGGTTTVNSGTCLRTPPRVLAHWREEFGLHDLRDDDMQLWFERVEEMLGVQTAEAKYIGPIGDVIADGARKLGYTHFHPLQRNATGCDGQGLCQMGCPTDAKRSTNVSYVPAALNRGAFLYTGFKAEKLRRQGKTVTGIEARGRNRHGMTVRLTIHAPQVVVSMGTFNTPLFLRDNGVDNPNLGQHLSLHPAGVVNGWFPQQDFRNGRTIPQGYGLSDLAEDGLVFEGGTIPFAGHGLLANLYGDDYVRYTERYQQTAYFGFMLQDTSRGSVRAGLHRDAPLIRYHMNDLDFSRFLRGIETLAKIYFAAGAVEVSIPGPQRLTVLHNETELAAFLCRKLKPTDFIMSAYHPLGTARLAATIEHGVCDSEHRVFGWQGLTVMDGSVVPSSLGANPQITIMSLAARAASRLADRILKETPA